MGMGGNVNFLEGSVNIAWTEESLIDQLYVLASD